MNRIAELRNAYGYSQAYLGKMMGVAQNTISNWEKELRFPGYDDLKKLAYHLDCSIDYLLGASPQTTPYTIPLTPGDTVTISDEQLAKLIAQFLDAMGIVSTLPSDEQTQFIKFVLLSNTMLRHSKSIGSTDNLMGQSISVTKFIEAATAISELSATMTSQAFDKFCKLECGGKPDVKISFSSK